MTQAPTNDYRPLCRHPQCESYVDGCRVADLAWSDRDRLLAIARRRVASTAEAEDVVSEAMTRALECPDVDPARAAAWLTAVTIRLCIDHSRDRAQAPKRWLYSMRTYPGTNEFEDDVIDTLSAAAIAPLLDDMPEQQRRALQMRADGDTVATIAVAMSLSEKAVESLLGRARVAARSIVAGLASGALMVAGLLRRQSQSQASAAISTAMAFAMTTVAAVHFVPPSGVGGPQVGTAAVEAVVAVDGPAPPRAPESILGLSALEFAPSDSSPRGDAVPAREVVRPAGDVTVGIVKLHDSGAGRTGADESLADSLLACVQEGIEISPSYVGCRSAKNDGQ